ncbi:MAG TPA: methyltransferase domain-containing protein [Caldimonas sp.]|jgi:malonyl-CoA O-methyltransferase|nr:methyltransferase domain-containing protein [Caldimonas sp.]HEX2540847.1 methyltransferase domain-containing protein [Caldimonas sp.]
MAAAARIDDDRSGLRRLDAAAVDHALRRIVRASEPPWLHGETARRLGERLDPIRIAPRRILDWWAGVGAGEPVLRSIYPRAEIVPIERDRDAARERAERRSRPWWTFARATSLPLNASATDAEIGRGQLVWANMVLQFVADPPALFARWHRLLEVDGIVAFSCLGPASLRELRELYGTAGWPPPAPEFVDMHDLGDMLVHAGFADPVLDQETLTLRWQSGEALLAELRLLGGNAAADRFAGLRTPAWRQRLLAALAERAAADGSIGLSIEVAYGHGFKAAPKLRQGEPVAVPLDDMRAMVRRPRSRT